MNKETTNINLWDRMRLGDASALKELYGSFYQYLFRFGFAACLDKEIVKDAIHDIFINIWVNREKMPQVTSVGGYLRISVHRKILDTLKRERQLHTAVPGEGYGAEFSYEEIMIALQAEQKTKKVLEIALESITKTQREVIRLRFFENKTYEEIALHMGSEPRTVYNHVYEGIKQLRHHFSSNRSARKK